MKEAQNLQDQLNLKSNLSKKYKTIYNILQLQQTAGFFICSRSISTIDFFSYKHYSISMNINTEYFTKSPVRKLFIQVKNVNPLINKLDGKLKLSDYIGILKAYLGIRRNSFKINPGIYSLGSPDKTSPVLVTANYKMSVDYLRNAVKDMNVWIMVLDTKGVNVWCAAGKGTFGTDEIINRIKRCNLVKLISHRKIIVPQLGAPGINPVQVKKQSGFSVVYGPVKAKDIPLFIKNDFTASKEMRIKQFNILERIAVSITHLSQGFFIHWEFALFFLLLILYFCREISSVQDLRWE